MENNSATIQDLEQKIKKDQRRIDRRRQDINKFMQEVQACKLLDNEKIDPKRRQELLTFLEETPENRLKNFQNFLKQEVSDLQNKTVLEHLQVIASNDLLIQNLEGPFTTSNNIYTPENLKTELEKYRTAFDSQTYHIILHSKLLESRPEFHILDYPETFKTWKDTVGKIWTTIGKFEEVVRHHISLEHLERVKNFSTYTEKMKELRKTLEENTQKLRKNQKILVKKKHITDVKESLRAQIEAEKPKNS